MTLKDFYTQAKNFATLAMPGHASCSVHAMVLESLGKESVTYSVKVFYDGRFMESGQHNTPESALAALQLEWQKVTLKDLPTEDMDINAPAGEEFMKKLMDEHYEFVKDRNRESLRKIRFRSNMIAASATLFPGKTAEEVNRIVGQIEQDITLNLLVSQVREMVIRELGPVGYHVSGISGNKHGESEVLYSVEIECPGDVREKTDIAPADQVPRRAMFIIDKIKRVTSQQR